MKVGETDFVWTSPPHDVRQVRVVHVLYRTPAVGRELVSFHEVRVGFAERAVGKRLVDGLIGSIFLLDVQSSFDRFCLVSIFSFFPHPFYF